MRDYVVFCMEQYKNVKNISGKHTIELFRKYEVMEYIMECFEALHTIGNKLRVASSTLAIPHQIMTASCMCIKLEELIYVFNQF